jgi:hypothetical protein
MRTAIIVGVVVGVILIALMGSVLYFSLGTHKLGFSRSKSPCRNGQKRDSNGNCHDPCPCGHMNGNGVCHDCFGFPCGACGNCDCACYSSWCQNRCTGDPCAIQPTPDTFAYASAGGEASQCFKNFIVGDWFQIMGGMSPKQAYETTLQAAWKLEDQNCPTTCNDPSVPRVDLSSVKCQTAIVFSGDTSGGISCEQLGDRIKAAVANGNCQIAR